MNFERVTEVFRELEQPAYRLDQARRALYVEYLGGWQELTTFSKTLRDTLEAQIPWSSLRPLKTVTSSKGDTVKTLFAAQDEAKVEAVLMRHEGGRNTVCISSQVGCAMACTFCATGTMGLKRNLTSEEIVDQVLHFARLLKSEQARVTNVVFMGMGEPFHNYDLVMAAIRILNDQEGFALGARHITISTCGIVPGILRLSQESLQVNLAISLHSASDETRTKIMPVNRPYPLKKLMDAVDAYAEATNRKVFFEYLLLRGINDHEEDAEDLVALLGHNKRLYHVNLIKYHETESFSPTARDARMAFLEKLHHLGMPATHRISFGEDIDAACGQLAVREKEGAVDQGRAATHANRSAKKSHVAVQE